MRRLFYLDWLRILAILAVFLFHSTRFFDPYYWHVKNAQQTDSVMPFLTFLEIWIMPLFFFLSGATGIFGIQKSFKAYLGGKTKRLFIPLLAGVILIIPPQKYVEALSHQTFSGGYLEFMKGYFSGGIFHHQIGFSPLWIGALSYHLWFIGHLLIISVVLFPLIRLIATKGKSTLDRLAKATSFPGGALLMFLPVAIVRIILKKQFPEYTGWSDLAIYSCFFLMGFIYTGHEGLKQTIVKSRYAGIAIGTLLFAAYMLSFRVKETFFGELFQNKTDIGYYAFQEAAAAMATWSWILFFVAMGLKQLNHDSKNRKTLNEAVLPFYILHQTVLLLIGYIVVQWDWSIWGKLGLISFSSFFITVVIYWHVIRPFNIPRYFFGMNKNSNE